MKPAILCLCACGLLGSVVPLAMAPGLNEVTLPLYEQPVTFFEEGRQGLPVGWLPDGITTLSAEACAGCHPSEHAEWSVSAHARAATEPVFAAAFNAEPRAVCRSCHAPLIEQQPKLVEPAAVPASSSASLPIRLSFRRASQSVLSKPNPCFNEQLLSEGVNCITCHVRDGTVLTANPTARRGVPHALSYSPRMRQAEYCGGCHQFEIANPRAHPFERAPARPAGLSRRQNSSSLNVSPANQSDEPPVPPQPGLDFQYHMEPRVQHTLDEYRLSAAAAQGVTCQSCHMPVQDGRRRHHWPGRSSPSMLGQGILLSTRLDRPVYREGDTLQAVIQLRNQAGHRFPTGDGIHAGILDAWLCDGDRTLGRQVFVMSTQNGGAGFALTDSSSFFITGRHHFMGGESVQSMGASLEAPERSDTRLLPGEEVTLVYRQRVSNEWVRATRPVLRVRVFHSAVHPGFRGTSIDPKRNTLRLIHEETLPVRVAPPEQPGSAPVALRPTARKRT